MCKHLKKDTDVGGGFPVASHLSVMSSVEKVVTDSGWAVITGGLLTAERNYNQTFIYPTHS